MRNKKYWMLELIALFTIIISLSVFYLNLNWIGLVFNSDVLFIPDMFNDLMHGGYFQDWVIATTGMFFPDWLVFYIAYIFTKNIYFQFLIVACINTILLYLLIRLIYSQFFKQKITLIFSISSILMFLFFAIKCIEPYVFLMVLGQHVGGFLVGLFYIYLQLKYIVSNKNVKNQTNVLILMACISFLMGASDLLFILQFQIPLLVVYLFMYLKKKCDLKSIFLYSLFPLFFSFISFLLTIIVMKNCQLLNLLTHSPISSDLFNTIKHKLHFFITLWQYFSQYHVMSLLFFLFYAVILINIIFFIIKKNFWKNKFFSQNDKNIFLTLFVFFSVAINLMAFFVFNKDGAIRYIETYFYFPIIIFFFIASFYKKNKLICNFFKIGAFLIMIFSLLYLMKDYRKIFTINKEYYPFEVSCIDNALKNHGHYGVANYWIARPFSMFSHENLHITEIFNNLSPFTFATNLAKVTNRNSYSFVIMNVTPIITGPNAIELEETDIININGIPNKKIICGSKKLLIYKINSFKIPVLKNSGDSFSWPAILLPSQFNNSFNQSTDRYVKSTDGQGYVTFGPYIPLASGKYKIEIIYASDASPSKIVGHWDIVSGKKNLLNVFPLSGTDDKLKKITGELVAPENLDLDIFQIRTFTLGNSKFRVKSLNLIYENLKKKK